MEWLIRALRVIRELRDWADGAGAPGKTNIVQSTPTDSIDGHATEADAFRLEPLGPAERALDPVLATSSSALAASGEGDGAPRPPGIVRSESSGTPRGPRNGASRRRHTTERPRNSEPQNAIERRPVQATESPIQEIPLEQIDPHALEVIRRLRRFGYRAYLVGGCVRDLLLGIKPKDWDVATSARPEEIKALFRNSRIIGRRFRLAHVFFRGGKIIETSTFRASVTPQEDESEEAQDLLIRRDNVFGTEEEDARRRDFTLNALFYDVGSGRVIDHVGGLEDLRGRYLRMIGDPDIRLREDPVRILRGIRIAAKVDLIIDPELFAAMSRHKDEIIRCAPARVLEETLRLLRIGHASTTVHMMEQTHVLRSLLPEIWAYLESEGAPPAFLSPVELAEESAAESQPGEAPAEGTGVKRVLSRARPESWKADGSSETRREILYRHLAALDVMIVRAAVSDAVALGALFFAPIMELQAEAEAEGRDRNRAIAEFLENVGARLTLTRRLSEHIRQVFAAQRHFVRAPENRRTRRRMSPSALSRRSFFADAVDLFEIHARATGVPLEEVERWRAHTHATRSESRTPGFTGTPGSTAPEIERGKRGRRRRRRA